MTMTMVVLLSSLFFHVHAQLKPAHLVDGLYIASFLPVFVCLFVLATSSPHSFFFFDHVTASFFFFSLVFLFLFCSLSHLPTFFFFLRLRPSGNVWFIRFFLLLFLPGSFLLLVVVVLVFCFVFARRSSTLVHVCR
jgi:hypothetical protein